MSLFRQSIRLSFRALLLILLAACNLQLSPALTPTLVATPTQEVFATVIPSGDTLQPSLIPPPLDATPTQLLPAQIPPTAVPLGGTPALAGTGLPTLSAALADDRYEFQARSNTTVGLNYNIAVITGSVTLTVQGPDGLLWQQTFTASENSRAEFNIQTGGTYEVLVDINNFDGNYSFSWS